MVSYIGIVIFYPIISLVVNKLLGQSYSFWKGLLAEFYLWVAFTILFIGAFILIFAAIKLSIPAIIVFIIYTIVYFVISVLRKTLFTESKENMFQSQQKA